jgi:hypothetical protein
MVANRAAIRLLPDSPSLGHLLISINANIRKREISLHAVDICEPHRLEYSFVPGFPKCYQNQTDERRNFTLVHPSRLSSKWLSPPMFGNR